MPRHSAGWRLTAGILAIAALSVFAVSCNERGNPPHIAQFGDSLSWEAEGYYTWLIRASRETALTYDSVGGTAICDWLPRMREVEAAHHPTEVELEFSGNSLTSCMHGYPYGSHAYYNKYRADTLEAISIFAPPGGAPAHVFLVGGPITRPQQSNPDWDKLNLQYAEIAAADPQHVSYVDAGTAVEGPDHTYSHTLACLPVEPCNGPPVNGVPSNIVRSPDGTHFCPDKSGAANGVVDRCPVYSSGAFRYAEAMVDPLEKSHRPHSPPSHSAQARRPISAWALTGRCGSWVPTRSQAATGSIDGPAVAGLRSPVARQGLRLIPAATPGSLTRPARSTTGSAMTGWFTQARRPTSAWALTGRCGSWVPTRSQAATGSTPGLVPGWFRFQVVRS